MPHNESRQAGRALDAITRGPHGIWAKVADADNLPRRWLAMRVPQAELLAALQRLSESFRSAQHYWAEVRDELKSLPAHARSAVYDKCAEAVDKVRNGAQPTTSGE